MNEERPRTPDRGLPTELPLPYKGVTDEVLFELAMQPDGFTAQASDRLRRDNPYLANFVAHRTLLSLQPDITRGFTLAYYEVYARSAEKGGIPMPLVSEGLTRTMHEERVAVLQVLGEDQERLRAYFESEREKQERRVAADMERSRELAQFWPLISLFRLYQVRTVGRSLTEVEENLTGLYEIQLLLNQQVESNRLKQQFSSK